MSELTMRRFGPFTLFWNAEKPWHSTVWLTIADVEARGRFQWWVDFACWFNSKLYVLGVISGSGFGSFHRDGVWRYDAHINLDFRPRPYVLGRQRKFWFHLPRFGHGYYEVMGMCGKCAPWPCCGSIGYDHAADCGGLR